MKIQLKNPASFYLDCDTTELVTLLKDQVKQDPSISVNAKSIIDNLCIAIKGVINNENYLTNDKIRFDYTVMSEPIINRCGRVVCVNNDTNQSNCSIKNANFVDYSTKK